MLLELIIVAGVALAAFKVGRLIESRRRYTQIDVLDAKLEDSYDRLRFLELDHARTRAAMDEVLRSSVGRHFGQQNDTVNPARFIRKLARWTAIAEASINNQQKEGK